MCSGHYFKRRLGLANGIVTAGSSVFTIALSFINQFILETHGVSFNSVRGNHVMLSMNTIINQSMVLVPAGGVSADDDCAVQRAGALRPLLRARAAEPRPRTTAGDQQVKLSTI